MMTDDKQQPSIKRPVVSELDGTREGGLAFCVALFGGMVVAAAVSPGSLASFWVWIGLLSMAVAVAVNTKRIFARRGS